eukprot:g16352.t1
MGSKFMAKLGLGPFGLALLVFDVISLILDMWDPAGYNDAQTAGLLRAERDQLEKQQFEMLKNEGLDTPLLADPMFDLPPDQQETFYEDTMWEWIAEETAAFMAKNEVAFESLPDSEVKALAAEDFERLVNMVFSDPNLITGLVCKKLENVFLQDITVRENHRNPFTDGGKDSDRKHTRRNEQPVGILEMALSETGVAAFNSFHQKKAKFMGSMKYNPMKRFVKREKDFVLTEDVASVGWFMKNMTEPTDLPLPKTRPDAQGSLDFAAAMEQDKFAARGGKSFATEIRTMVGEGWKLVDVDTEEEFWVQYDRNESVEAMLDRTKYQSAHVKLADAARNAYEVNIDAMISAQLEKEALDEGSEPIKFDDLKIVHLAQEPSNWSTDSNGARVLRYPIADGVDDADKVTYTIATLPSVPPGTKTYLEARETIEAEYEQSLQAAAAEVEKEDLQEFDTQQAAEKKRKEEREAFKQKTYDDIINGVDKTGTNVWKTMFIGPYTSEQSLRNERAKKKMEEMDEEDKLLLEPDPAEFAVFLNGYGQTSPLYSIYDNCTTMGHGVTYNFILELLLAPCAEGFKVGLLDLLPQALLLRERDLLALALRLRDLLAVDLLRLRLADERSGEDVSAERRSTQKKFVKLSGRDHILQRSDMYCGSLQPEPRVFYLAKSCGEMVQETVRVAPAFLQVFEEVLMNAADRVSVSHEKGGEIRKKTTSIQVTVSQDTGEISVWNNGDGIPTHLDEDHGCHIPELVFGHLRTSSNYDDNNERLNVGRNGIGVKIVNIFSRKFVVETVDAASGTKYRQKFTDNMSKVHEPSVTKSCCEPYTKVSFALDIERFGCTSITDDMVSIMRRRAHEVCLCSLESIKVTFNRVSLKTNAVERYMELLKLPKRSVASATNDRWKVGFCFSPSVGGFRHMSFVNSTCTPDGGTHVTYVVEPFIKQAMSVLKRKIKSTRLKPALVREALTVVVSAHIVNPTFSSQTKDKLTLPPRDFGSTFEVTEAMVNKVLRSGLSDYVAEELKNKEKAAFEGNDGKKVSSVRGLPKLHDAKWAGTRHSSQCLLIVTEGDSALTFALSAMSVIGRDKFGAFPLRGKLLNVRDASSAQLSGNAEIAALKKIIGLQTGVAYEDTSKLRYGGVVLLTDADLDGSHIKGLLLNLFDVHWPSLLRIGFVKSVHTPVVKATRGAETRLFYNEFEYKAWRESVGERDVGTYRLKYLKGLGSSTAQEARQYFSDVQQSLVTYEVDDTAAESMSLAFCKKRASDRKQWLATYDGSEIVGSSCRQVSVTSFVNNELKHFSRGDLLRSIPSVVDGLKVSQRKALCGSLMRGISTAEAKVAQLTGFVADKMRYHHGETSISGTLISLAQDFVGSNNINLLLPRGQLGSRLEGGADAASPRYTFVQMNPVTPQIFMKEDSAVLRYTEDEGQQTEPVFYCPIISVLLVNGAKAIATGYSTSVPQFNPQDLINNVRRRIRGFTPRELEPFYRGFTGKITKEDDGGFTTHGIFTQHGSEVTVSELPVGTWSATYKRFLESLVDKKEIVAYTESCTDVDVLFVVTLRGDQSPDTEEITKLLKLTTTIKTSNMHAFDAEGNIRLYRSASEIEEAHFNARLATYGCRKAYIIKVLQHDVTVLSEKIRFMKMKVDGTIRVDNVSFDEVISTIEAHGFRPMGTTMESAERTFDYIVSIKLFDFTTQNVAKLAQKCAEKQTELTQTQETTVEEMWLRDLDCLENMLYSV